MSDERPPRVFVSTSLSGGDRERHKVPAVGYPTPAARIGGSDRASTGERQRRAAVQGGMAACSVVVGLELATLPRKITAIPEQHLVEAFAAHRPNQALHGPGELNCYIESIGNSINQRATYWLVRLNSTAPISQFGSRR